ncbi:hypothetical protein K457DRAFT_576842 [Linnemannia elongata AG-77]|uniref:Uncharacterized protein n=1 Tax=Linnemannia elongata AG-77 TaxID=1314771 RepID=A0A197KD53_9FUNG|nr:hypothetical protein K457DRAFT_576842 [Linnemannia elongata AG-77]
MPKLYIHHFHELGRLFRGTMVLCHVSVYFIIFLSLSCLHCLLALFPLHTIAQEREEQLLPSMRQPPPPFSRNHPRLSTPHNQYRSTNEKKKRIVLSSTSVNTSLYISQSIHINLTYNPQIMVKPTTTRPLTLCVRL